MRVLKLCALHDFGLGASSCRKLYLIVGALEIWGFGWAEQNSSSGMMKGVTKCISSVSTRVEEREKEEKAELLVFYKGYSRKLKVQP